MSRRGYCHNVVAEGSFLLLKRERVRRHIYATQNDARADSFSCIEMFYIPEGSMALQEIRLRSSSSDDAIPKGSQMSMAALGGTPGMRHAGG